MANFICRFVLAMACALVLSASSAAAEKDSSRLELKTEKVIVFKDGHALVLKRGSAVTNADGEIHTLDVPDSAVLGSFWATPQQGRMINLVAGWHEETKTEQKVVQCMQTIEILQANVGKR